MNAKYIDYQADGFNMEGYIAIGDANTAKQPLVLIVHDWRGSQEFDQEKARYFAKQGFVAFAADMYGKGKRGSDQDRSLNTQLFNELIGNRHVIVPRLQAALACAQNNAKVDPSKIMLLGFCMGGLCVLDLARSGAEVAGVVSVHGAFKPLQKANNTKIKAKVLALHGYEDKGVSPQDVLAFADEMTKAGADWQIHMFGNTYHAFTNPKLNDPEAGLKYSATADARTWELVRVFTDEIFK